MKKYLSIIVSMAFIIAAIPVSAQLRKIPAPVTTAFEAKYPGATQVEWKDQLTDFKATFTSSDNTKCEAKFSSKGVWKKTEQQITEPSLPSAVRNGFAKSKYSEWKVKDTYILHSSDKAVQYHIVVAKSDIDKKHLLFNSHGKMLKDNFTL
ncbi:PepSY-like domain-containing protein [Flavitalea flava]